MMKKAMPMKSAMPMKGTPKVPFAKTAKAPAMKMGAKAPPPFLKKK